MSVSESNWGGSGVAEKIDILGVKVDSVTMAQAVAQVEGYMDERKNVLIATANAEMIMRATHDTELKDILNDAALVVPDGAGTVWAAHHLGYEMPERVAGFDLAQELMRIAPSKKQKVFFFGSAPGVAEKAKAKAEELYPGIEIVGTRDGYFKPEDEPAIIEEIKAAQPDLLLAALGVPKQEKWLNAHLKELGVPVAIGVGGTLDVMAGVMKRAPYWMQKAKLEWLFRGLLQPKRAGRLMALPKFVLKVHGYKSNRA
ncbi:MULTISPECIES: WecB/TagA/CpsF family glycosyltransferase [Selenomonas]|uniref:WecB/TagA/CpsF family glycosyltransferase n=1 Tax=Selenomonas TaxID=970 RepID=UPI00350EABE1